MSSKLCAMYSLLIRVGYALSMPFRLVFYAIIMLCDRQNSLRGDAYNGLKSEAGCLHQGQIKSSGSVSLSWI